MGTQGITTYNPNNMEITNQVNFLCSAFALSPPAVLSSLAVAIRGIRQHCTQCQVALQLRVCHQHEEGPEESGHHEVLH